MFLLKIIFGKIYPLEMLFRICFGFLANPEIYNKKKKKAYHILNPRSEHVEVSNPMQAYMEEP